MGENGAGKTNILEALSLFSPGRGLRRADLGDIIRKPLKSGNIPQQQVTHQELKDSSPSGFSVAITLETDYGEKRLGTGGVQSESLNKGIQRVHRVDGVPVSSASAFSEYVRVLWLTPDMDGLFRGSAGERRRFLDRLVLAIDKEHGTRVNALERALRSRNRILEENPDQYRWLDAIEKEIAELGIAVTLARRETVERLSSLIEQTHKETSPFPFAVLEIQGDLDRLVQEQAAADVEERYQALLRQNRLRDRAAGRTLIGPQASDLAVRHGPKNVAAEYASTGEQKALLVGLILAQAHLIKTMSGIAPLVLLDEISAHLDRKRREALFSGLEEFSGQVWITGADKQAFQDLKPHADIFEVTNSFLHPVC